MYAEVALTPTSFEIDPPLGDSLQEALLTASLGNEEIFDSLVFLRLEGGTAQEVLLPPSCMECDESVEALAGSDGLLLPYCAEHALYHEDSLSTEEVSTRLSLPLGVMPAKEVQAARALLQAEETVKDLSRSLRDTQDRTAFEADPASWTTLHGQSVQGFRLLLRLLASGDALDFPAETFALVAAHRGLLQDVASAVEGVLKERILALL